MPEEEGEEEEIKSAISKTFGVKIMH